MSLETILPYELETEPMFRGIDGNPILQGQESAIRFELMAPGWVTLKAYDLRGHHVATLASHAYDAGVHVVAWAGEGLPAGVYVLRLTGPGGEDGMAVTVLH